MQAEKLIINNKTGKSNNIQTCIQSHWFACYYTSPVASVSVKIHWYTPASEAEKLEILRELVKRFVQFDVETTLPLTVHDTVGVDVDAPICLA